MRFFLKIIIIVLVTMTPLLSGNNPINFEDFFSVNRLGTPVVSPDGQKIAFTVKKGNINDNNYSQIAVQLKNEIRPPRSVLWRNGDNTGYRIVNENGHLPGGIDTTLF